jgi:hypothetical protein
MRDPNLDDLKQILEALDRCKPAKPERPQPLVTKRTKLFFLAFWLAYVTLANTGRKAEQAKKPPDKPPEVVADGREQ